MVLMLVHLQGAAVIFRVGRHHHRGQFCEGRGRASHTPSQTHLPLVSRSPRTHRGPLGAGSHSPDRILRLPCGRLAPAAPYMFSLDVLKRACRSSPPACWRAGAFEVRYRAAVGVGEEAHSRQRDWCPWSKPVNVETWGHVLCRPHSDGTYLCRAIAELGKGTKTMASAITELL
jgi:hypothetical protein